MNQTSPAKAQTDPLQGLPDVPDGEETQAQVSMEKLVMDDAGPELQGEEYLEVEDRSPKFPVVYFVQPKGGGPIKIGRANRARLQRRIDTLQTGLWVPLVLVGLRDDLTERDVHGRFARFRIYREWFEPVPELVDFIHAECRPPRKVRWPRAVPRKSRIWVGRGAKAAAEAYVLATRPGGIPQFV